jgi:hypothetical protein
MRPTWHLTPPALGGGLRGAHAAPSVTALGGLDGDRSGPPMGIITDD